MRTKAERKEEGQSLVLVTIAIVVIFVFVVLAVDVGYAYVHRRSDQNAADAAALAGARELADLLNECAQIDGCVPQNYVEGPVVKTAMYDFAEQNGIENPDEYSDGHYRVEGRYVRADLSYASDIDIQEMEDWFPVDAAGVRAIAHSTAPSFFGGILGLDGLNIQAESTVAFQQEACAMTCIAPIATQDMDFQTHTCYNIWDGARQTGDALDSGGRCSNYTPTACADDSDCDFKKCKNHSCQGNPALTCNTDADCVGTCEVPVDPEAPFEIGPTSMSSLGWLNWSMQGAAHSCRSVDVGADCSESCQEYNLRQDTCLSGRIAVGDWVAGTAGVKNSHDVRGALDCYLGTAPLSSTCPDPGGPITVVIYDTYVGNGCNQDQNPGKMKYHVVGFAKFTVLGYQLAQGRGTAVGHDGSGCADYGTEGNRITGEFLGWVDGEPGDCDAAGTIIAPRVLE
ncbi:MAG TPA: pilus assembly protein TadG-related protein [Anaerolineae bacterium]|nr:pilus assembly protein TadG-related protein [Anaerolineae bacterium]